MKTLTFDPVKEFRAQIGSLTFDPVKEYQEQLKALDPLKEFREQMRGLTFDPLKVYREQIIALDPLKEFREQMGGLTFDLLREYREQLKALDPMKEFREQMRGLTFDPLKEYREQLKALDPLKEFREQMRGLTFDPLKEYREQLKALDPMKEFREQMRTLTSLGNIRDSLTALRELQVSLRNTELATASIDGTVVIGSQSISKVDLEAIVDDVVGRALVNSNSSIERALHSLIEEIKDIRDPFIQKVMTWLVFPLIVGLILAFASAVADFYVKEWLSVDKRQLKKEIKSEVIHRVGRAEYIGTYRLVIATTLNVRERDAARSRAIGMLQFGQIVELVEKRKDWSLVRWREDENDLMVQGWVFSRYLEAFR